jgi:glutaredoxin/glutathione-dependent peroxiredoxin
MSPAPGLIPSVTLQIMRGGKPTSIASDDVFSGKNVALFGMPGAFTPACHYLHLPGILADADSFRTSGTDLVVCTAVNDVFVMDAWARSLGASDDVLFLADGNGDFARALGLLFDGRSLALGYRSKRYAMWVKNGFIQYLSVEPEPTMADVSSAYSLLKAFDGWVSGAFASQIA